ncbi:MAG: ADP-forming succinate--CoA ligase subunit beta, partial [Verrucomicrobia bacterium]|nr:ADP-forming succinate--CoA ligase subunit beta [Verrucomicrobiota bacterium]
IPEFEVASTLEGVEAAIEKMHLEQAVIKVQVHAGGRGKAGGVKFAKSKEEILAMAKQLIGMKIVNEQTGPRGVTAQKVIISAPLSIDKEYYIGAFIDRELAQPILMVSKEGGMEIEEVAVKCPEKILKLPITLSGELKSFHLTRLIDFMHWTEEIAKEGAHIAKAVAKAFIETDASLLEINPLVESKGHLWVLDTKISVDDNALFRHPDIASLYDPSQQSKSEVDAKAFDLAYVAMEGNIGCMVNGAGLAMATMDLIYHYGGKPANFLDVGGGSSKEKVAEGFKIILEDPKVKVILVNIFGGIMDCGVLAEGIIAAIRQLSIKVPLIVRMEGTNVEKGRELLKESKLAIVAADSLTDAAEKAVSTLKSIRE